MSPIIQEVVAVEVKLRFKNETYDFYLTGALPLPPNFAIERLLRAAQFIITQNTPPPNERSTSRAHSYPTMQSGLLRRQIQDLSVDFCRMRV
jgi:uncharacterized membrane protein (GlpM family)